VLIPLREISTLFCKPLLLGTALSNIFYETAFDISSSFKSVPYFNMVFHVIYTYKQYRHITYIDASDLI